MKNIFISLLFLFTVFCVSKFIFDPANLYYEIWWLDIPMHIIGGFGVALLASSILAYKKVTYSYTKLLITYCVIAITWEFYEYFFNPTFVKMAYSWLDTFSDLLNGLIGMTAYSLFVRTKK